MLFFQTEAKTDKIYGSKNIYETLIDHGTKPMLYFLQYILQKINALNIEFQSEHFRLHQLYLSVSIQYKNIISFFIKEDIVNNRKILEIDVNDKRLYKNIEDIYLGGQAISHLISEPFKDDAVNKRFRHDCLKVLVELANQIKKRFSFSENGVVSQLRVLDPKLASDVKTSPVTIIPLATHFPSIVNKNKLNELDDQWRSFRLSAAELTLDADNIPKYWHSLRELKDGINNCKFSLLSDFMTTLTVLPHSSASVERIFSQVNCVKTKTTNALKTETVRDRLLAKQCLTKNYSNCLKWQPPKTLIKEHEKGILYQRYEKHIKHQKEMNVAVLHAADMDEDKEDY